MPRSSSACPTWGRASRPPRSSSGRSPRATACASTRTSSRSRPTRRPSSSRARRPAWSRGCAARPATRRRRRRAGGHRADGAARRAVDGAAAERRATTPAAAPAGRRARRARAPARRARDAPARPRARRGPRGRDGQRPARADRARGRRAAAASDAPRASRAPRARAARAAAPAPRPARSSRCAACAARSPARSRSAWQRSRASSTTARSTRPRSSRLREPARTSAERGDEALAKALTPTPLVVRAAVVAAREHRYVNASIDLEREEITLHRRLQRRRSRRPAPDGLTVPVVHDADRRSLRGDRARDRRALARPRASARLRPSSSRGAHVHGQQLRQPRRLAGHADRPPAAGRQPRRRARSATGSWPSTGEPVVRPVARARRRGRPPRARRHTLAAFVDRRGARCSRSPRCCSGTCADGRRRARRAGRPRSVVGGGPGGYTAAHARRAGSAAT